MGSARNTQRRMTAGKGEISTRQLKSWATRLLGIATQVGNPEIGNDFPPKRCGAVDLLRGAAQEKTNRLMITHESYDAKMQYDKTDRKIDSLTNPLSGGTRAIYSRSWRRWSDFAMRKNTRRG